MAKAPDAYAQRLLAERARREAARQALASAPKREPQIGMPSKLGQMVSRQPSPDRVGQVRQAITQGVDYAGNVLMQGRAPEIGGVVRQMVEPVAQFPVTAVTDPLKAANQAQQVLDPAYAMARGLTTTRLGAEAGNPAEMAAGVTEMGLAGLSFIPGGAAVKGARAMPPARLPEIPQPRNVLAQAKETAAQPRNVLATAPEPIRKAQAEGYQGADIGEAQEWVSARSKGLDMSQGARLKRAKDQGFTITGYHGTAEDVTEFSTKPPMRFGKGKQEAIFFTEKPDIASSYAVWKDRRLTPQYIEAQRKGETTIPGIQRSAEEIASRYQEGSNVMPVKLRLTQPLVVDAKGKSWSEVWDSAVEQARKQNADGVVMKNVQDWGDTESAQEAMSGVDRLMKRNQPLRTVYAVFDPSNIRSTNAAFDPAKSSSANILATPPELGGAFVGGALGGTQGETPEERARNALLGAAGGAIGGRLASRAAIDRTRMGSNLGNVPKPVQKAQAQGYEGADIGEAQEWVSARSKGLDMSQPARLDRAKAMGFDTGTVLYHGTGKAFSEFNPPAFASGRKRQIYLTDKPEIADIYANSSNYGLRNGGDPMTYPVFAKAEKPLIVSDKGPDGSSGWVADNLASALGVEMPKPGKYGTLYEEAKRQGYDQIQIREMLDIGGPQTQFIPLDPSNIRSVNAAFDPASKESANILAGVGAVGAGAAMTGAIRPPEQKKTPGQRPRG